MATYDVISIGVSIMDCMIRGFDPSPVSATGYLSESASLNVGGDAVNEALASAKLGMRTAILTSLGRDTAGEILSAELERSEVDTSLLLRSDTHPTPVTTIFIGADGDRKSITNASHRYNFHPERYADALDARAVILGSLFRAPFNDPEVIRQVVQAAKSRGVLVFADTKLPNYGKLSLDDIADILPLLDYITPNEKEGLYYTGETEPERMAETFLQKGIKNVIIKLGAGGCFFRNAELSLHVPAYEIDAVDATGAGDNFMAGLISELLCGKPIEEALQFASACGAVCCLAAGANTALKSRQQVLQWMAEH